VILPRNKLDTVVQLLTPANEQPSLLLYKVRPSSVNPFLPYSSIQPSHPILVHPAKTLKDRVVHTDRGSLEKLFPLDTPEEVYALGFARDRIHFVRDRCTGMQFRSSLILGRLTCHQSILMKQWY